MLQLLDQYILRQMWRILGFSVLMLVGMFWLGQSVPLIEQVVLRGETIGQFFQLSFMLVPKITKLLLPVAALIAVVFVFNSLASNGELAPIYASGRRPVTMLRPVVIFGIVLMFVHGAVSVFATPAANNSLREQLFNISQNYSKNIVVAQKFISPVKGLTIYAEQSLLSGEMISVFIDDRREQETVRTYFADRAVSVNEDGAAKMALISGEYHEQDVETGQISVGKFDRVELDLDIEVSSRNANARSFEEWPTGELIEQAKSDDQSRVKALAELVDRLTFPLLSLFLPLIGAAGFLTAPHSRDGYRPTVLRAIVAGLALESIVFSFRGLVEGSVMLVYVIPVPFVIVTIGLFLIVRKSQGSRK